MIKKVFIPIVLSFVFLNATLFLNFGIFKSFLLLDFEPFFLVKNFDTSKIINLYLFLALMFNVFMFHIFQMKKIVLLIPLLTLSFFFYIWYCDTLFVDLFDQLFEELSKNKNLIKVQ